MTKAILSSWRYQQMLLPTENSRNLTPVERQMFASFCDEFWKDNVRSAPPMPEPLYVLAHHYQYAGSTSTKASFPTTRG